MFDSEVMNANFIWAGQRWKPRGTTVEIHDVDKARGDAQQTGDTAQ